MGLLGIRSQGTFIPGTRISRGIAGVPDREGLSTCMAFTHQRIHLRHLFYLFSNFWKGVKMHCLRIENDKIHSMSRDSS